MALITAAEARLYQPHLSGTGEDTDLDTLIARVGRAFARWCFYPPATAGGNPTLESASYTLYSGSGLQVINGGSALIALPAPITAIASIYDDPNWDYAAGDLVDSANYSLDGDTAKIYLKPTNTHGVFSAAPRAIKLACTAGFTTVPDEIKQVCALQVRRWWDSRRLDGGLGEGAIEDRTGLRRLDPQVLTLLYPFRRFIMRGA